ncbi:MAG: hypothetical protein ACXAE3_12530 [Candidatus Kariarchaeaceae archaeon]|jgi:hypothetical protein
MMKGKLLVVVAFLTMLALFFAPAQAWPSDDQGGWYYVNEATGAPTIDGEISGDEWLTNEEFFKDTYGSLSFDQGTESGLAISIIILTADDDNLYIKVTWEAGVIDDVTPNSIGLAFASNPILGMQSTWDRKIAYYDGAGETTSYDLFGCLNAGYDGGCNGTKLQPGVVDSDPVEFESAFGFDTDTNKAFFEFKIPMTATNDMEDLDLSVGTGGETGTYLKIVVNPYDNIANEGVGHGAVGSGNVILQDTPRCFFCRPESGGQMDSNSFVFNAFFGLMISAIFLSFVVSRRNEGIAEKLWKVDITEDMKDESVIMEMAYYNSNFLSVMITVFFSIYALIGLLYGFWAQWGMQNIIVNGLPLVIGIFTTVDLIRTNQDPADMESRPGTDVNESEKFWLVPTLFLAVTLLMLVFIGIDVIA